MAYNQGYLFPVRTEERLYWILSSNHFAGKEVSYDFDMIAPQLLATPNMLKIPSNMAIIQLIWWCIKRAMAY